MGVTEFAKVDGKRLATWIRHARQQMGSDSPSALEIVSEMATPAAAPAMTVPVPIDLSHLLEQAITTCEKHERLDIINTYLCNLHVSPKEVFEIANNLEYIAHLQDDITTMFVPIRY